MALRCPACGASGPEGKRFCADCGAALSATCPSCGADAAPGKRFCADCGAPLTDVAAAVPAQPSPAAARVAERRVTSVLFADLVGFTPMAENRDPEEVRELLSTYFAAARTVVARYGGTVEKFIGDAVMAVWGVPSAHEDDAERAVRAGLDLLGEVVALRDRLGAALDMRVGVVTGEVAVTVGAVGEGMVAGDAVNTAARVQGVAEPGQVWVDQATRDLSAAAISYVSVGEHPLKGKAEPVRLFAARAVVGDVGGSQRVDGLEAPFVGRERELRLVKELFHGTAEEGRPRLVAISGVAGVGKSRLGWEFEKYIDGIHQTTRWHHSRALSYGDGVAFWSLAEMVRSRLQITDGDPTPLMLDRLTAGIDRLVPDTGRREWLRQRLAVLLGLDLGRGAVAAAPREELFAAWTAFFASVSGPDRSTVVMVFEDMQYADPALLDFLEQLLETARFPLFVLTLARPELAERRPSWGSGRRATAIYLEPLGDEVMATLVDGLVEGLPVAARQALVDRSEGIPLYAVETVRTLIDRDAVIPLEGRYVLAAEAGQRVDLAALGAPASLQALISARLDALSPDERQAVADASVHGLAFSRDGLAATTSVSDLDTALAGLVRKEILTVLTDRFSPERGQYRFVQSLVRTVAYETLSRRDRKASHLAVAAQLQAGGDEEIAAVVAQHYLDALDAAPTDPDADELRRRAVELLERGARRAESLGSQDEALRLYRAALDREGDPAGEARLAEGAARVALGGAHAAEAAELAGRARDRYEQLGRPVDAARVVAILGATLVEQSRLQEAISLMRPVYDGVAEDADASSAVLVLAQELARAHFYLGENATALVYADRALKLADRLQNWPAVVSAMNRYAVCWQAEGAPSGGLALLQASVQLAQDHHLPHAQVIPLANLAALQMTRDLPAAERCARQAMDLAEQVGARDLISGAMTNLFQTLWFGGAWDEVDDLYTRYASTVRLSDRYSLLLTREMAHEARGQLVSIGELPDMADIDEPFFRATILMTQALLHSEAGRAEDAHTSAAEALRLVHEKCGLDDDFGFYWVPAVELALAAGDLSAAQDMTRVVSDAPPGLVSTYVHAQLLRLQGLLAQARGRGDEADGLLADAARELRTFGARYYLGRSLLERGRLLLDQGDADRAQPVLDEARATFVGLQAAPWVAEVDRVAALVG